jgi:glycosyltransferase involved in cell wall biosynthesis
MPKISAVVPSYYSERTIEECLRSLLLNNVDEIILVDGGSRDSTLARASRLSETQIIHTNGGIAEARDLGWKAANHPYVLFLDSDTYIEPGTVTRLWSHFSDENIAGVCCAIACANTTNLLARYRDFDFVLSYSGCFEGSGVVECFFDPMQCGLFSKKSLSDINGFDLNYQYAEDLKLLEELKEIGYRVLVTRDALVYHYHREKIRDLYVQFYRHGWGRRIFVNEFSKDFYKNKDPRRTLTAYLKNLHSLGIVGLGYPVYRVFTESAFLIGYLSAKDRLS